MTTVDYLAVVPNTPGQETPYGLAPARHPRFRAPVGGAEFAQLHDARVGDDGKPPLKDAFLDYLDRGTPTRTGAQDWHVSDPEIVVEAVRQLAAKRPATAKLYRLYAQQDGGPSERGLATDLHMTRSVIHRFVTTTRATLAQLCAEILLSRLDDGEARTA